MSQDNEQFLSQTQQDQKSTIKDRATAQVCSGCSHHNEATAQFCEECGASLQTVVHCSQCGAEARTNADICEICGAWLLEGQCKFCYAAIDEGGNFCSECGNPVDGIVCPKCNQLSFFDFCSNCNIPLTSQAKEMVSEPSSGTQNSELSKLIEQALSVNDAPEAEPTAKENDEIESLRAYRKTLASKQPAQSRVARPLFDQAKKDSIGNLSQEIEQEEERRRREEEQKRLEEERRRQEEERKRQEMQKKLQNLFQKMKGKTFSSNQEARRYFMSIVAGLPEEIASGIINNRLLWRCNAYDVVHNHPGECGAPSQGGIWFIQ